VRRVLSAVVVVVSFVVAVLVTPGAARAAADNCALWTGSGGTWTITPWTVYPLQTSAELSFHGDEYGLLRARADVSGPWERFSLVCVDSFAGTLAIKSPSAGLYVSTELGWSGESYGLLRARSPSIGPWEKFHLGYTATGSVFIRSDANGRYVSVEKAMSFNRQNVLRARATEIGEWEEYYFAR
jgi:hypothetical protein